MNYYLDTSALVAIYIERKGSNKIKGDLLKNKALISFWSLIEIELHSALIQMVESKSITETQKETALINFQIDQNEGRLIYDVNLSLESVSHISLEIINKSKYQFGTLDTIHVAAAKLMECDKFITLDERQQKLATREKLNVLKV